MTIIKNFISQYGVLLIYTALTAVLGFLGSKIKEILKTRDNEETKEKVVKTCVKAVEQLYKELDGTEKLTKAKENILSMLTSKGIEISEIEMDMLIEACVSEINSALKETEE